MDDAAERYRRNEANLLDACSAAGVKPHHRRHFQCPKCKDKGKDNCHVWRGSKTGVPKIRCFGCGDCFDVFDILAIARRTTRLEILNDMFPRDGAREQQSMVRRPRRTI